MCNDFFDDYAEKWFYDRLSDIALRSKKQKGFSFNQKRPGCKGGLKHKEKINQRIKTLENEGLTHINGGTEKEEIIKTPSGHKTYRKPDITMERVDGTKYRENVGKSTKSREPIAREKRALDDMEQALGQRPGYTPYDEQ